MHFSLTVKYNLSSTSAVCESMRHLTETKHCKNKHDTSMDDTLHRFIFKTICFLWRGSKKMFKWGDIMLTRIRTITIVRYFRIYLMAMCQRKISNPPECRHGYFNTTMKLAMTQAGVWREYRRKYSNEAKWLLSTESYDCSVCCNQELNPKCWPLCYFQRESGQ